MESEHASRRDRALSKHDAFDLATMTLARTDVTDFVWETLEQPSMAYFSGKFPGTSTLEFYVSQAGHTRPTIRYPSNAEPRKVTILTILERLRHLETGLDAEVGPPIHLMYAAAHASIRILTIFMSTYIISLLKIRNVKVTPITELRCKLQTS